MRAKLVELMSWSATDPSGVVEEIQRFHTNFKTNFKKLILDDSYVFQQCNLQIEARGTVGALLICVLP